MKKNFELANKMVVLSTENQVVNYVPIKYILERNETANLTVYSLVMKSTNEWNKQEKWHENLEEVLKEKYSEDKCKIEEKKLEIENDFCMSNFLAKVTNFLSFDERKIVWNITGGQRTMILSVLNFISVNNREDDIICYFDGNTDEIYLYNYLNIIGKSDEFASIEILNEIEDFSIEAIDILKLYGFKDIKNEFLDEEEFTENYEEIYEKLCENPEFRKEILSLNKKDVILNKKKFQKFDLRDESYNIIEKKVNKLKNIGNLFEEVIFWKLINEKRKNTFKRVNRIYCNYKIWDKAKNPYQIDEIDILIVLRTGKMLILELKTGVMENKDESKSTIFTANFLSGAYGKALLVLPITVEEKSEFKKIMSTMNQAARCDLEYVYIDEIIERIEKIVKN